jgi:hypothetical protein
MGTRVVLTREVPKAPAVLHEGKNAAAPRAVLKVPAFDFAKLPLYPGAPTPRPAAAGHATPVRAAPLPLQAKLEVGAVDDPLEKEADLVADRIVRAPEGAPPVLQAAAGVVQRKGEEEEEQGLRRKAAREPVGETAPPAAR